MNKTQMETNKMEKTILEEAKNECLKEAAKRLVLHTYSEDRPLYDRALGLVNKLGLGGLWNGLDLAMERTIRALQSERLMAKIAIERKTNGGKQNGNNY